jgi:hypothetical protein
MTSYHCYFIDNGCHVADREVVSCRDDDAARVAAATALLRSSHPSVEVWDGRRCVAYLDRQAACVIA